MTSKKTRIRAAVKGMDIIFIVLAAALILLTVFFTMNKTGPRLKKPRNPSNMVACGNNLKAIGIAMILYSNDYQFFPHLAAADQDQSPEQVSECFRKLIHAGYLDDTERLICRSSKDKDALNGAGLSSLASPSLFEWPGEKPGLDPPVSKNNSLSYTTRRKPIHAAKANATTILTTEKGGPGGPTAETRDPLGFHTGSGHFVGFADGHASWARGEDSEIMNAVLDQLQLDGFENRLRLYIADCAPPEPPTPPAAPAKPAANSQESENSSSGQ